MNTSAWIPTACYQCKAECAILVRVEDGVVKEIRGNPKARGKACVKGMAGIALEYSPDRLLYPMKRVGKRGEGKFERISWDKAMEILTEKLEDLRDRGLVKQLCDDIAPNLADRNGGYLRIVRCEPRRGDNAEMAYVELIGAEHLVGDSKSES